MHCPDPVDLESPKVCTLGHSYCLKKKANQLICVTLHYTL
ncbi:hypothetical protein LINPERHAP1_LOCUS16910 [Linum perenne]